VWIVQSQLRDLDLSHHLDGVNLYFILVPPDALRRALRDWSSFHEPSWGVDPTRRSVLPSARMALWRSLPERPQSTLGSVPLLGTSPRVTARAYSPQVLITMISRIIDMIYLSSNPLTAGL
jgi:hypothetical protein